MAKAHWMQGAVKKPGALNAEASEKGESKAQLCSSPAAHHQPLAGRCGLWKKFRKFGGKRGTKRASRMAKKAARTRARNRGRRR